jgi:hypothetical protein
MKTTEASNRYSSHVVKIRSIDGLPSNVPFSLVGGWSRAGVAAVVLAAAVLIGRVASFIVPGPSSLSYLVVLLLVAVIALALALRASSRRAASVLEGNLVSVAKRVATLQTILGAGLIVLTLT